MTKKEEEVKRPTFGELFWAGKCIFDSLPYEKKKELFKNCDKKAVEMFRPKKSKH